jgi:hypothetical protein
MYVVREHHRTQTEQNMTQRHRTEFSQTLLIITELKQDKTRHRDTEQNSLKLVESFRLVELIWRPVGRFDWWTSQSVRFWLPVE